MPADALDLATTVRDLAVAGTPRIVVAGGDGTIGRVINSVPLSRTDMEFAVIPLGTGNDLARSLDLPIGDLPAAFALATKGAARPLDIVHVKNGVSSFFVNAATGGFGGEVTAALSSTNKSLWGPFSYWMSAMAKLVDLHAFDLHLELDGEGSDLRVYGMCLANGRYVGGGFPIAAQALLNDGYLDVVIIPELQNLELLGAGVNFMLGWQSEGASVITKRAKRVIVSARPAMSFSLDGEPTSTLDAWFEVVPSALRVVAGEKAALSPTSADDWSEQSGHPERVLE